VADNNGPGSDVHYGNGRRLNSFESGGFNVIGDGNATSNFIATGDLHSVTSAGLGALADNGGGTLTHLPGALSHPIDRVTGIPDLFDQTFPVLDQRGISRPQGTHSDSGSVEVLPPDVTPPTVTYPEKDVFVDTRSPVTVSGTISDNVTPPSGLILQAVIIDIGHAGAAGIDENTYRYFDPETGLWTDGSKTTPKFYGIQIEPDGTWSVTYDPADVNGSVSIWLRAFDAAENNWPADKDWQAIVVLHDDTKPTATLDPPFIIEDGIEFVSFQGTMTDNESPIRKGKIMAVWQRIGEPSFYWNGTGWVIYNEANPDLDILRQQTELLTVLANQTDWIFTVPKPGDTGFVIAVVQPENGSYGVADGVTAFIELAPLGGTG
jgi:hypothetical protein